MLCPDCGCEITAVIDSRKRGGMCRRRHKCLECNCRFSTMEILVDDYEALLRDALAFRKISKVVLKP